MASRTWSERVRRGASRWYCESKARRDLEQAEDSDGTRTDAGDRVFDGFDLAFRFAGHVDAAAFDASAENLLVAVGSELLFVGLDPEVRVRAAYDLEPLRAAFLGQNKPESLSTAALHAVLFRHGTARARAVRG